MAAQDPHHRIPLSASLITQTLVTVACLMAGIILPTFYPEFRDVTQTVLYICGGVAAVAAITNVFFGRHITQLMTRMGMRSRVVIPREGLVYLGMMLLLAVGGLVGHSNMLLLVFGLMAGPWVINGWFVYTTLRHVRVERHVRDRVMAGETVVVDVTARNDKSWFTSRLLDVQDEITGPTAKGSQQLGTGIVTIVRLPAGEQRVGHYRVMFRKRGSYELGPIRISSRFPLGVGERGQTITNTRTILVRPQTGRLRTDWMRRQQDQIESRQTHSMRSGVFHDEFHHIREFRADDSPRTIHWRSSARRGELMVQEFHQNRESDLFVLLDLCTHPGFSEHDLELTASTAATLCAARTYGGSDGKSVLAITGRTPAFVHDSKASRFANEALDALALCQPADSPALEPALKQLADAGALHRGKGILITSRPEYCRLAVTQICADLVPDVFDVMKRLTVVPATTSSLNDIVVLSDLIVLHEDHGSAQTSQNGVPEGVAG